MFMRWNGSTVNSVKYVEGRRLVNRTPPTPRFRDEILIEIPEGQGPGWPEIRHEG